MGIYDRDYERDDSYSSYGQKPSGIQMRWPRTATMRLVLITAAFFLVQVLTDPRGGYGWFTELLSLHQDHWKMPWRIYEFLSYGFLHDTGNIRHILFNMFGLWMFGQSIEQRFGPREMTCFYLLSIVFSGFVWIFSASANGTVLGASGGVTAIIVLFAFCFRHRTIYLMGVVPMPAWVLGILCVGGDMFNALNRGGSDVAYVAHLGGAAFAAVYYLRDWRLSRFLPSGDWSKLSKAMKRKPKLRVHHADEIMEEEHSAKNDLESEVDRILDKIQQQGQDSLTRKERRTLEKASKRYKDRRDD